jgi:hypothetical protein
MRGALFLTVVLLANAVTITGFAADGPVAAWACDEGQGATLRDGSGNGNDGTLHGPEWVRSGKGFALRFDGQDDYVDCGSGPSLDLTGPLTLQAWVRPSAPNRGEPGIAGKFFESYALTYYGSAYFYISSGGNNLSVPTKLDTWSHVVGTFDGTTLRVYLNGDEVAAKPSAFKETKRGARFTIGCIIGDPAAADPALRNTSFFPGLIDAVRVHNRALNQAEVLAEYNLEAEGKGLPPFDVRQLGHFRLEPFYYPEAMRAVLSINSRRAVPLPRGASASAELVALATQAVLRRQSFSPDAPRYEAEAEFDLTGLPAGDYEMRALARAPQIVIPAEAPTRQSPAVTAYSEGWQAGRMNLMGGWAEYDVEAPAGRYRLAVLAARIHDAAGIRCQIDGTGAAELSLNGPESGGAAAWQNAGWADVGVYALAAGKHTLRVEVIPVRLEAEGTTLATHVYIDEFALQSVDPTPAELAQADRVAFKLPFAPPAAVPSPVELSVGPLPLPVVPPAYRARLAAGGGIEVEVAGRIFRVESRTSYPDGGDNRLTVLAPARPGEAAWRVQTAGAGTQFTAQAAGAFYRLERTVTLEKTRLVVRDTLTNLTQEPVGISLANGVALAGLPEPRVTEMGNPTVFVGSQECGLGLIALDDLYQCQVSTGVLDQCAEVRTEHFGLDKGAAYTLEWAIYPTATASYYDFINQVRRDEGLNRRVEGAFAFVDRRTPPTPELMALKNLRYTSIGCLGQAADNPALSLEGFEFTEYPKECALLKQTFAQTKALYPDVKVMFHVAHSLYITNRPDELFADSRILDAAGVQTMYGGNSVEYYRNYLSQELIDAQWRWYLFYPTLENRFGKAMLQAMQVMVDEIGATGMWADGYFCGYAPGGYSYDRWDGHSVTLDPQTRRIVRQKTCVAYAAIPVLLRVARLISEKGGVLVSNDSGGPRSFWREDIITSCETGGGDAKPVGGLHLGRTVTPLGNPLVIQNGRDVYRDILGKLDMGALYFWYGDGNRLQYKTLVEHMYPITFDSIHEGTVRGLERIVTRRSGIYGWQGDRSLHCVYRYDGRGALTRSEALTTVDSAGVRTRLDLAEQQSAAVVRIPCTLSTPTALNLCVRRYDRDGLLVDLSGVGNASLQVASGDLAVRAGATYRVTLGESTRTVTAKGATLEIALDLQGPARVQIVPEP